MLQSTEVESGNESEKPSCSIWSNIENFYTESKSRKTDFIRQYKNLVSDVALEERATVSMKSMRTSIVITCPICEGKIYSKQRFITHIARHEGIASKKMICPLCEKSLECIHIENHFQKIHPEIDSEETELKNIRKRRKLLEEGRLYRKVAQFFYNKKDVEDLKGRLGVILEESIFSLLLSCNHTPESFRAKIRQRFLENPEINAKVVFRLLYRSSSVIWSCCVCEEASEFSFNNLLSPRLHALSHCSGHVDQYPSLESLIEEEWAHIDQMFSFDLQPFKRPHKRLKHTHRTFLNYCWLSDREETKELLAEAEKQSILSEPSKRESNAFCLLCFSPLQYTLRSPFKTPRHFRSENHLQLHAKGLSEWGEVEELAEASLRGDLFPHSLLLFSPSYYLVKEDDSESLSLYKWRCFCSLPVCSFPSTTSLRVFALRHLEREHPNVFIPSFYEHEWRLLQYETGASARDHDQLALFGDKFDLTDPNDFVYPGEALIRPKSLAGFRCCGFCFVTLTGCEFLSHIEQHHYVPDGNTLFPAAEDTRKTKELCRLDPKVLRVSKKLLGPNGKKLRRCISSSPDIPPVEHLTPTKEAEQKPHYDLRPRTPQKYREEQSSRKPLDEESAEPKGKSTEETEIANQSEDSDENGGPSSSEATEHLEDQWTCSDVDEAAPTRKRPEKGPATLTNTCESSTGVGEELLEEREKDDYPARKHPNLDRCQKLRHNFLLTKDDAKMVELDDEGLAVLREFKNSRCCLICSQKSGRPNGLRVGSVLQGDPEWPLLSHLLLRHQSHASARKVIEKKSVMLSDALNKGGLPLLPPFLMRFTEEEKLVITCSSCGIYTAEKLSTLQLHFASCLMRQLKEKPTPKKEPTARKRNSLAAAQRVRCELCGEGWRASVHYSDGVSLVIHLLSKHTKEKQAYQMAIQISEKEEMESRFPFLDIPASFADRVISPSAGLRCSKCPMTFDLLSLAVRHSRKHLTPEERVAVNFPAGGVNCPLAQCVIRTSTRMRDRQILFPPLMMQFVHILLKHPPTPEAESCLESISQRVMEELKNDKNTSISFHSSLKIWRESSASSSRKLLACSRCDAKMSTLSAAVFHNQESHEDEESNRFLPVRALKKVTYQAKARPSQGKGTFRVAQMKCVECGRRIPGSTSYSKRVTVALHAFIHHEHVPGDDASFYRSLNGEFPFVDWPTSYKEKTLHCSLCEYSQTEMHYFLPHAWTKHPEESERCRGKEEKEKWKNTLEKKKLKQRLQQRRCKRKEGSDIHSEEEQPQKKVRQMTLEEILSSAGRNATEEKTQSCEERGSPVRAVERQTEVERSEEEAVFCTPLRQSKVTSWLFRCTPTSLSSAKKATLLDVPLRVLTGGQAEVDPRGSSDAPGREEVARRKTETGYGVKNKERENEDVSRKRVVEGTSSIPTPKHELSECSVSLLDELPEKRLEVLTGKGVKAEDVSHIKGVNALRCALCSFQGADTRSIRIHFSQEHAKGTVSEVSGGPAGNSTLAIFTCVVCSKLFNSGKKLRRHCDEEHKAEQLPYACTRCSGRYGSFVALRSHETRVHESAVMLHPRERTCHICKRLFRSLRSLKEHTKRMHPHQLADAQRE